MTETCGPADNEIRRLPSRLVKEGTIGDCPNCGSTTLRKYEWPDSWLALFGRWGKKIGCIQSECENYYNSTQNKRDRKLEKLGI